MVVTLLAIANSHLSSSISELGIDTIAPANLMHSHRILESSLRVEIRDFPIDQLIASSSYHEHIAKLAAYTERLEIHRKNDHIKSLGLSVLSLIFAFLMLIAGVLSNRKNKN